MEMPVEIFNPRAQPVDIRKQQSQFLADRTCLFPHTGIFQDRTHRVQRGHAGGG